jgi:hypothetical protein
MRFFGERSCLGDVRTESAPFLLYEANARRNAFSAKVNPTHPASYVFADPRETRAERTCNEGVDDTLFQQMGCLWDKAGTNFIPVLHGERVPRN